MNNAMDREQMNSFFSNSPIGTYVVQDGKFCFASNRFLEIIGYSEKDLFEKDPLEVVVPEDRQLLRDNAVAMLKRQRNKPYEFRALTAGGDIRWIIESVASMEFEGRRAVMGHFMDVTDTKRFETALKISEQKYRSIFEMAREGIILVNYSSGMILDANLEFQRQTGFRLEDLKSRKIWELQPKEFRKEARNTFFRFKENRGGLSSWKLYQNTEGKILPVEIVAQHMLMEGREVIICMIRDISEREAMIRALALASEEWRKSFDALDSAVMLIGPDFKIRRANMAASRLLDMDVSRLIHQKCHTLFHGTDHPPPYCPHVGVQKKGFYCEAEETEPHLGKILHFCSSPIKDNQGNITHTVEVISDVTGHRQSEEESIRLSKNLADSFKGITEALSELVESRDPYTAGHSKHVAELALKTGKEMGLSQADLDGLRVCAILHDVGKAIIPAGILSKPGKLSTHEWGFIREHPTTAYETLKRIPFPWPVADVVHQHHERLDGSGYPLGISDDKIHLWARIIAVADVFDAMTSHRPYRPGLPLREAIEELTSGLGTKYDCRVVEAINRVICLEDRRIMVVDTDRELVQGISAELEFQGLKPDGFTCSKDALAAFQKKSVPIVILELEMPEMNGVQLTRKIKELHPQTEVILIAKCDSREGSLRALRAGASDFLEKPVNSTLFQKTIARALQRYAGKRQR